MATTKPMTESVRRPLKSLAGLCLSAALGLMSSLPAAGQPQGALACGDISNGNNGPFDYRNDRERLSVVERYHFTPKVESLIAGESGDHVGGDISYTLRAYPNHPRALLAMMRWGEKQKSPKPSDVEFTIECYFERALRFRPDDNVVRMIYALFLSRNQRAADAARQVDQVAGTAGDNGFTHYNAGLLYFDLKLYDKALQQAHAAMALSFPPGKLRDQLQSIGKWSDPVAAAGPAASAASAASPS